MEEADFQRGKAERAVAAYQELDKWRTGHEDHHGEMAQLRERAEKAEADYARQLKNDTEIVLQLDKALKERDAARAERDGYFNRSEAFKLQAREARSQAEALRASLQELVNHVTEPGPMLPLPDGYVLKRARAALAGADGGGTSERLRQGAGSGAVEKVTSSPDVATPAKPARRPNGDCTDGGCRVVMYTAAGGRVFDRQECGYHQQERAIGPAKADGVATGQTHGATNGASAAEAPVVECEGFQVDGQRVTVCDNLTVTLRGEAHCPSCPQAGVSR